MIRMLENYLEMALIREGVGGEMLPDRPLAEEVRDVKATRRRLAASEADEASDLSVEDVLTTAYGEHTAPDSAEAWSAELERAETQLERARP